MMFTVGCFGDDAAIGPAQVAKVNRERDSREACSCRRAATFSDWDFVAQPQRKGYNRSALSPQNFTVAVQDEVIVYVATDVGIATAGPHRKVRRGLGFDFQEKTKGKGRAIKRRA
jgi:hypothetical protein